MFLFHKLKEAKSVTKAITQEEIAAAGSEEVFKTREAWEYILDEDSSIGDGVLSFFRKSARKYSEIQQMSARARKFIRHYKKLFNEISARNQGNNSFSLALDGAQRKTPIIDRMGENVKISGDNDEADDGIRLALVEEKVESAIEVAIRQKGKLGEKYNQVRLSSFPSGVSSMVSRASEGKISLEKKYIAINGDNIWHEYYRHQDEGIEAGRRQLPLTPDTIKEAIMAIYEPDMVESLFANRENPTQRQSFVYAKKSPAGYYVVAEAVGGRHNPNVTPAMILRFSEAKWNDMVSSGATLGEILYENDTELRASLDIEFNKKNRVTAAQFASSEAIANTPHSPRYNNIIHDNAENSNPFDENSSKKLRKSVLR